MSPSTPKLTAANDLLFGDHFYEPANGCSGRGSWNMKRVGRLDHRAYIDQQVDFASPGKGVAMNPNTRSRGQFGFHAGRLQCDCVIACFCCLMLLPECIW